MNGRWVPAHEVPEEYKDGREMLAWYWGYDVVTWCAHGLWLTNDGASCHGSVWVGDLPEPPVESSQASD